MADTIQRVEYFYLQVPNKAGEGSRFLTALDEAGINLLAFSGFPEGRGSQLDFIPADPAAFKQFARTAKWKLTGPKRAFLVSGEERVGAVAELHRKLAEAKINVSGGATGARAAEAHVGHPGAGGSRAALRHDGSLGRVRPGAHARQSSDRGGRPAGDESRPGAGSHRLSMSSAQNLQQQE